MTRNRLLTLVALLVVAGLVAWLIVSRKKAAEDTDATPTAIVTMAPVTAARLDDVATAYGTVQADPAGSATVAAPKAAIVLRVLVRSGETVSAGQTLIELANAPGSELAFKQASDAAAFAKSDLARVQRLYDGRLAASDQLDAAKKASADADATLTAEEKQGAGHATQTIKAPQAGIVTTVSAAAGDHVAQDAALLVLARSGAAAAKLGLQPSGQYAAGQAVTLRPIAGGASIRSRISMVGRAADQTTKTLDAIVPLNGASLPIGTAVEGEVVTGVHDGFTVPRAAVVFDETGPHVFTVAGGKAHRIFVKVGLDHDDAIEVSGPLPAGSQVAVEGAQELQDGMAVTVKTPGAEKKPGEDAGK
ncbi:MAG TPA: efflux RND transporter periplasmic adaptor subunit [Phenylobacterium sp.]|jgi:RND family efflux transporter MFP subunit|uniref:efflux RND transporter periplasmic adaptor subunit n=1 Tax=Phenylobacterium sp. TaxID=1871053 RepID=UPI002D716DE0|nr:efflux RND transporter periplasmic adaptor subunit [Phenylobacterium sp.]HZZ69506.1 efflux RND transporter periplasmic adaptor subunit [Phenylobacterium sp.]